MRCIGHGGASALARKNSIRSFELAAELGADSVEFDVRVVDGALKVAHTRSDARKPGCLELDELVRALASERFAKIGFVADLKTPGTEQPTIDLLREYDLLDRAMLTSQCRPILARVRAYEPNARLGISVGGVASRWFNRWGDWRAEVTRAVRAGDFQVVTAYRGLVDRALVERITAAGGELHSWTARRRADVNRLAEAGVAAVVTPDPRLMWPVEGNPALIGARVSPAAA